ncbi:hypothetical protein A5320_17740 [Rheinheimera sp. SA_1]|nr:hypothetical protein A5320_17740 [Rheinheimera sp. SA_1]
MLEQRCSLLCQIYGLPEFCYLTSTLTSFSKLRRFVAIAAQGQTAPATFVGFGAVVEPQNAVWMFSLPDQRKVAFGQ